ncbi:MAG: MraY family glycosyltransferase [Balneolaceae bacterium]|nr:MraY family glycosyltransferase [Balneolaceae bacterium]
MIIRVARLKNFYDQPDFQRKLHNKMTPTLGGVAIFLAFFISFSISSFADLFPGFGYFAGALTILLFAGVKDDIIALAAGKKLMAQLTASGLLIFGSGLHIGSFHGVFGLGEIGYIPGVLLTLFTFIVVINSFNLIDGIDGLAGGIGILASVLFGAGFVMAGQVPLAVLSFVMAGALAGFLMHNFSPASIFMGDTGSMIVGFTLAVQAISFVHLAGTPGMTDLFGTAAPLIPVAILSLPLYDTLRVILKRFSRGVPFFKPGQDHVHHELLRMGFSHKESSLILYGGYALLTAAALLVLALPVNLFLGVLVGTCLLVYPTVGAKRRVVAALFNVDWTAFRASKMDRMDWAENGHSPARNGSSHRISTHTQKEHARKEMEEEEVFAA